MKKVLVSLILWSLILIHIRCTDTLELKYMPVQLEHTHSASDFNVTHTSCTVQSKDNDLCIVGLTRKPPGFRCQVSQFQCLLVSDTATNCVSLATVGSQQHCHDGSDAAFYHLTSSFWELSKVSDKMQDELEPRVELKLKPMPVSIRRWLTHHNATLGYRLQIYQTIGRHVTNTLVAQQLLAANEPATYPAFNESSESCCNSVLVRLSNPVRRLPVPASSSQPASVLGYAAVVDLFVDGVAVAPALTRRFSVRLTPPQLTTRSQQLLDVAAYVDSTSRRVRVQAQVATTRAGLSASGDASPFRVYWRCPGNSTALHSTPASSVGADPLSLIDVSIDLPVAVVPPSASSPSDAIAACQFWVATAASAASAVTAVKFRRGGPGFSVNFDDASGGLNATADGGLVAEWHVPAAWSADYPPSAYNFTIDYWADLCGRGVGRIAGVRATRAGLPARLLNPATRYWASVRACDPTGCGPASSPYATAVTVGSPVPSVDLAAASTRLSNGTDLTVAWTVGPAPGWPAGKAWRVSLYYDTSPLRLLCTDRLGVDTGVATSTSASVRLDHLLGCSIYSLRVQVTDPDGYGPPSPIYLQAIGLSSTSPPKNVQYIYPYRGNATQALIVWNAPCIIVFKPVAYVLRVTDLFTQQTRAFYIDPSTDSVVTQLVTELELGRPYRLMIFTNAVGGKSSVPVVLRTDAFVGVAQLSAAADADRSAAVDVDCATGDAALLQVRWRPTGELAGALAKPGVRVQYEIYGRRGGQGASTSRTDRLWRRVDANNASAGGVGTEKVAALCLPPPPPPSPDSADDEVRQIRVRIRVLVTSDVAASASSLTDGDALAVAGAFSDPVAVVAASVVDQRLLPSSSLLMLLLLVPASLLLLALIVWRWRRRRLSHRWRRLRLYEAAAYEDASATLFPEHAAVPQTAALME